jgi:tyrosine-protein phosphatase SIW14
MNRIFRASSLLILLTLACAQRRPQAPVAGHPEKPMARRLTIVGVGNFAEVTPHLYRGGQPHGEGLESLAKMGINTIIDVRLTGAGKEREQAKKLGMELIPLPWHCLFPKDDPIAKFLAYMREHPDKKIFVHCRYGDDRTGMMIAAYRMAVEGWTAEEARKEMNAFGFHKVVCASLVGYEKDFPEHFKKNSAFKDLTTAPVPATH